MGSGEPDGPRLEHDFTVDILYTALDHVIGLPTQNLPFKKNGALGFPSRAGCYGGRSFPPD